MALLIILLAALGRATRTMLAALFDWSVTTLFGERGHGRRDRGVVFVLAAALWPLVALGVAFPRTAAYLVVLVPLPASVPTAPLRIAWAVLALLIPVAMGLALPRHAEPESLPEVPAKRILRGFPITLALGAAFPALAFSRSFFRIVCAVRSRFGREPEPPVEFEALPEVVRRLAGVIRRQGLSDPAAPAEATPKQFPVPEPVERHTTLRLFGPPTESSPAPHRWIAGGTTNVLGLGVPALCGLLSLSMLLVTVALLMGAVLPAWGAALTLAGATAVVGALSARAYRGLTIWPRVGSPRATGSPSAM